MKLKSYIEVYLEKPDDFTLSLVELESDATVWKAKLRESESLVSHYKLIPAEKIRGVRGIIQPNLCLRIVGCKA